jgi:hypothetical protein
MSYLFYHREGHVISRKIEGGRGREYFVPDTDGGEMN